MRNGVYTAAKACLMLNGKRQASSPWLACVSCSGKANPWWSMIRSRTGSSVNDANKVSDECRARFLILFVETPLSTIRERRIANAVTPTRSHIRDDVFEHHCARFQFPDSTEQYVTIATDSGFEDWIAGEKAGQRSAGRDITMRAAGQEDSASTRKLVADAFGLEGVESFLDALRGEGCLLGEWLAEDNSGTAGFIAFSRRS